MQKSLFNMPVMSVFQHASDVSIKADHKRPVPKLQDGPLVDSIRLLLGKMPNPLIPLISQCSLLLRLFPFLYPKLLVSREPLVCSRSHRWPKFVKTSKLMGKNSKHDIGAPMPCIPGLWSDWRRPDADILATIKIPADQVRFHVVGWFKRLPGGWWHCTSGIQTKHRVAVWKVPNCREGVEGLAQVNRLLLSRISPRGGIMIAKHKGIKPTHPSYVQQSDLNNLRSISAGELLFVDVFPWSWSEMSGQGGSVVQNHRSIGVAVSSWCGEKRSISQMDHVGTVEYTCIIWHMNT